MAAYFIRRLLLVPITFLAITFMVYAILRVVPGGPVEQEEARMKMSAMQGEGGGRGGGSMSNDSDLQLDDEALQNLREYYSLDRPIPIGYLQWLGVLRRPVRTRVPVSTLETSPEAFEPVQDLLKKAQDVQAKLAELLQPKGYIEFAGRLYRPVTDEEKTAGGDLPELFWERADTLLRQGFGKRDEMLTWLSGQGYTFRGGQYFKLLDEPAGDSEEVQAEKDLRRQAADLVAALRLTDELRDHLLAEQGYEITDGGIINRVDQRFAGVLQLDFGDSYTYNEPVLGLIGSKMEVSVQFGLIGYLLTWLVCVPLGVMKAIKHRTGFDTASSFVVFLGYSMPGFVVCMLLLTTVAAHGWLPLGGYKPDNIEQLGYLEAIVGRIRHMIIPITGYMIGSFATMTILMKNSLLENLGQDYVRTAFAKGVPERRVIFVHALRNSLIPITAGIGHAIGILFAGSFLIEKTCNIDGMGLLGYEAILSRDYMIIMGTLVIGVLIQLFGNILSDLIWAMIDPRIRFGGAS